MKERNNSIDLIRVVATFLVLLIHNLGQGGVFAKLAPLSGKWFVASELETIGIVAVNLFALITGFLAFRHKPRISRVAEVLLQATFWAWVVLLVIVILRVPMLKSDMVLALSGFGQYWYITSYFGMILISFVLRPFLLKLDFKKFLILVCFLLFFSCTYGNKFNQFWTMYDGYSVSWLLVLYIVGFFIAKFEIEILNKLSSLKLFGIYLGSNILTLGSVIFISYRQHFPYSSPNVGFTYVSPFVIIMSISLFVFFLRLGPKHAKSQEILKKLSSVAFGVYLIDSSIFFWVILTNLWSSLGQQSTIMIVVSLLLITALMCVAFGLLEWLRILLFKKVNIRKYVNKLDHMKI